MKRPIALLSMLISISVAAKPSFGLNSAAQTYHQQAKALVQANKLKDALEKERKASELDPLDSLPHKAMTFIYLQLTQIEDSEREAKLATSLAPGDGSAAFNLGRVLQAELKHTLALASYKRAIALNPDDVKSRIGAAECLLSLGRTDDSIALLDAACKSHAGSADLWVTLAVANMTKGNLTGAEYAALMAVKLDRHCASANRILGQIEYASGNFDQALLLAKKQFDLTPSERDSYLFLFKCMAHSNANFALANLAIEKAHSAMPSDGHLFYSAGLTFFRTSYSQKGKVDRSATGSQSDWLCLSERALRYAVDAAPDQAQCHLALSTVLSAARRPDESLKEAEQAGKLNPRDKQITGQISMLRKVPNDLASALKSLLWQARS